MHVTADSALSRPCTPQSISQQVPEEAVYVEYKIIRRNGAVVGFEPAKIAIALTKAFPRRERRTGAPLRRACARWSRN